MATQVLPQLAPVALPRDPARAAKPTVTVFGVSKWFGTKVAVSDISCSFGPGITGLLGPNGAGKTTLLRMITGLMRPSEGRVSVLGTDPLKDQSVYRRVGFVPEDDAVYGHLTARQLVRLAAELSRYDASDRVIDRAIAKVNLLDAADRPIAEYSKGMRQRAKVAAALVNEPDVLVLDEPLNGADPVQRAVLIGLFHELAAAGRTIIVSSHVLAEVERMTNRVIAILDGKLAAAGSIRAIRAAMTHILTRCASMLTIRASSPGAPRRTGCCGNPLRGRRPEGGDVESRCTRHRTPRNLDRAVGTGHSLRTARRLARERISPPAEQPPMTPLLAIVRVTIGQLTGRTRLLGFGLLSLAPAVLLAAASRSANPNALDLELGVLLVTPFFALVIPVTTLILASSALGEERREKTLSFLVLRPISRLEIAVAKIIAAVVVSTGFALLGALALSLTWMALGGSLNVFPSIAFGATLACVMYSAVFVLLGNVLARSTLVGLLYVLFFEYVIVEELPRLASASLWRIGLGATLETMPAHFPARALLAAVGNWVPSVGSALIVMGAITLITISTCTILLKRTDAV
jgi:ABC-2 type transport system ATP-binding protein